MSIQQARAHGVPLHHSSWAEARDALWEAKWELALPLLVLLGIYGGFTTAGEAAVVTAVYSLVITTAVHRDVHPWRDLPRLTVQSTILVGAILIILGMALVFGGCSKKQPVVSEAASQDAAARQREEEEAARRARERTAPAGRA